MRCSAGHFVAFACLMLTLGSFVVPESEYGASQIAEKVFGYTLGAKEHVYHQGSAWIAHLKGRRHCRPPPNPLLKKDKRRRPHVAGIGEHYKVVKHNHGKQWLVDATTDGLLSIMTPIYPDEDTLAYLLNQMRTANYFLNMDSIKEWIFITPERVLPKLVRFLEEETANLPCVLARKMRVIADETCAPELRPEALQAIMGDKVGMIGGWMKQQLIKLSCSFMVKTPYFLITDADMFYMADLEALDLMHQNDCTKGSGVCDLHRKVQFRARNEMQPPVHDKEQSGWISESAIALNMSVPKGNLRTMGVTPQILSRAVLDPMAAYIESSLVDKKRKETWRAYLLRLQAEQLRGQNETLRGLPAWTEYDLYWEFARNQTLWSKYHTHTQLQRATANVWHPSEFTDWSPCVDVDYHRNTGYWAVVQSTAGVPGEKIWTKLEPCMRHSSASGGFKG